MSPIVVTNSSPSGRVRRVKAPTPAAGASPFFEEVFTGGVRNDANGFTWNTTPSQDTPNTVTVSADRAYAGTHSLKFLYAKTTDGNCELRFNLGRNTRTLYVEYQMFVETGFYQDLPSPLKLFAVWRETYSDVAGGTQQILMESWARGDGNTRLRATSRRIDQNAITDISPIVQEDATLRPPLIGSTGPMIRGQWNRVRFIMELSSAYGVNDGRYKAIINETVLYDYTNEDFYNVNPSPSDTYFRNGYFMGYTNAGFVTPTAIYIDDLKFYDTDPGWS